MITTTTGLQYEDTVVGDGAEATKGQTVTVHYTGWLYKDGEKVPNLIPAKTAATPSNLSWAQAWSSEVGTKAWRA